MPAELVQIRPVVSFPKGKDGLFTGSPITPLQEEHLRMGLVKTFQYADSHCGDPRTFDPKGNYLCGDCNKFIEGGGCLLVFGKISGKKGSCRHWENKDASDPELKWADKLSKEFADYGESELGGFGCHRCQYRIEAEPDSVGRDDICRQANCHVADNGCCALNKYPGMKVDFPEDVEELKLQKLHDSDPTPPEVMTLAADATMRTFDKDGRLHIARSHISKASVNPYYGREIPRSQALGLDPDKIYMMLRPPDELAKAAPTFARLPILAKHTPIANFHGLEEKEKKRYIVGTIGSDVEFLEPFLDADVSIWDADAIAGIESEQQCEFSCGYSYEPIMTTGKYAGEKYDGIMTQIQGNHLALVESGRAGPEVRAADSKLLEREPMKRSKLGNALIVALTTAFPKVQIAADSELEKKLAPATRTTFGTAQREEASKLILAMDSSIDRKQVFAVMDALSDVDDPESKKKDNEDPEPARDKKKGKDGAACDCDMPDGKHTKDCKMGKDAVAEEEEEKKRAKDKKAKDDELEAGKTMDAKIAAATDALRQQFKDAEQAKRDVRPIVGDVIAQDSADKIYEFALDEMKIDHAGVTGTAALRALFTLAKDRAAGTVPAVVMDSSDALKRFPGMGRIRQA